MENKYFTPDIEDLYVGYECEQLINQVWVKDIFAKGSYLPENIDLLHWAHSCIINKNLRVPYLTKEQIENEGFVYRGKVSNATIPGEPFTKIQLEFIKNNILIRFDIISNKVMIDKANIIEGNVNFYNVKTLYDGECKDINTFRLIQKLLGIK